MIRTQNTDINFGAFLSSWRRKRRFSQLSFSLLADVSSRHISFLETGRARPSREMVLKLAGHLDMPKTEINHALLLAGFSPAYLSRAPDDADLAPIKQAISMLLDNHMPYPAMGLDQLWNIKMLNASAAKMLSETGLGGHTNMIEALAAQTPEQSPLENWDEAVGLLLEHLRTELRHRGDDSDLQKLIQKLAVHYKYYCHKPYVKKNEAVIPARLKIGTQTISLFSTIVNFSTVQDIALGELKIELMFPMDEATKAYFT